MEATIFRACRKALGLCKNDSKDMMIAPLLHMGFGLTSLVERGYTVTARTLQTALDEQTLLGQFARALMDAQLRRQGRNAESILQLTRNHNQDIWMRKLALLRKLGLSLHGPAGFGGAPDNLQALLAQGAVSTTGHLTHLHSLWRVGITDTAQLTRPASSSLYSQIEFCDSFPGKKDAHKAFEFLRNNITPGNVPFRNHQAAPPGPPLPPPVAPPPAAPPPPAPARVSRSGRLVKPNPRFANKETFHCLLQSLMQIH